METLEILKQCTVDGQIVRLPDIQLDRKQYLEVAKKLELIGGKWKGGKVKGFVFEQDPTELLQDISSGEDRNLKKEYQFFETPDALADLLCSYLPHRPIESILEPSAGRGAIVRALNRTKTTAPIYCCELMELNRKMFKGNAEFICADFFEIEKYREDVWGGNPKFDVIVANPPFAKNQDIDHFMKMVEVCRYGGRIISVMSRHWQTSTNRKETEFRNFLEQHNAEIVDVDAGVFKESGTNTATCIVIFDKD